MKAFWNSRCNRQSSPQRMLRLSSLELANANRFAHSGARLIFAKHSIVYSGRSQLEAHPLEAASRNSIISLPTLESLTLSSVGYLNLSVLPRTFRQHQTDRFGRLSTPLLACSRLPTVSTSENA